MGLKDFLLANAPQCCVLIGTHGLRPRSDVAEIVEEHKLSYVVVSQDALQCVPEQLCHLVFSRRFTPKRDDVKKIIILFNVEQSSVRLQDYIRNEIIKCRTFVFLVVDDTTWTPWVAFCKTATINCFHLQCPTYYEKIKAVNEKLLDLGMKHSNFVKDQVNENIKKIKNYAELDLYTDCMETSFETHCNQIDRKETLNFFQIISFLQSSVRLSDWDRIIGFFDEHTQSKVIDTLQNNAPPFNVISETQSFRNHTTWLETYSELDTLGYQTNSNGLAPAFITSVAWSQTYKTWTHLVGHDRAVTPCFSKLKTLGRKKTTLIDLLSRANRCFSNQQSNFELYELLCDTSNVKIVFDSLCTVIIDPLVVAHLIKQLQAELDMFEFKMQK
jgi:hypothetical protein